MTLFGYWRSSATWRVRIALQLKGVEHRIAPVNLLTSEHKREEHSARNPMGQVPVLELDLAEVVDDGAPPEPVRLTQSMAILHWLEAVYPDPPLFPTDALARARAVALAELVNAGIHPLQNLSVLSQLQELGIDRRVWGREVIQTGLVAYQDLARPHAGAFSEGDTVTVADLLLVPQLYNARRFDCDLDAVPLLTEIEARCAELPAFKAAHPDVQPDAQNA